MKDPEVCMRKSVISIACMISTSFFLFFVCPTVSAADWNPLKDSNVNWQPVKDSNSFFAASKITRISPSVIRAWESVFPEKYPKYPDLPHTTILKYQIDCKKQTIGLVSRTHYNSNGVAIYNADFEKPGIKMNKTVPGSHDEAFAHTVCDYVNAVPKKKKRFWNIFQK